jgi:hypothetical protein
MQMLARSGAGAVRARGAGTSSRALAPLLALVLLLACAQALAQTRVGTLEQVAGLAWAIPPGGTERTLARGDALFEGDTVVTASDGELLLRMIDDAVIAVRAGTRFTITRYQFAGRERTAESASVLSLVRGALRTVTGVIGRQNPRGFQLGTTTSTIGVRGTDFETLVLEEDTPEAPAGTYQRVNSGATVVTDLKTGQSLDVSAGQVAFAALNIAAAAQGFGLLRNVPPVFRPGRYDNLLQAAADLLQQQLLRQAPSQLRQLLPGLPGLLR